MQPPHHHPRINLADLKAQIVKRIGQERSKQYFYFLNSFLSLKLSKVEFNKLCLRSIGRENIPLHNQLIRSILRNASCAKAPPPSNPMDDVLKHGSKEVVADGYLQNGSHTNVGQASGLSNGADMLPLSPRKVRSSIRDRSIGDRRSALGPSSNGKATQPSEFHVVLENGDLNSPPTTSVFRDVLVPSCSKDQTELVVSEDSTRSPLRAPLGVPLCPVHIGGGRKALPPSSSTFSGGALLDSLLLRERMQQIARIHGLEGVSMDSANILNHGLDSYLKGLIRSCIELVGSRSKHPLTKNDVNKNPSLNLINGVKQGYSGKSVGMQEQIQNSPISLQDFRLAMEMNPRKLGEDWPLLLEKICTHAFEE